jgi:hypothetical protein
MPRNPCRPGNPFEKLMLATTDQHITFRKGGGDSETPDAAGAETRGGVPVVRYDFFDKAQEQTIGGKI